MTALTSHLKMEHVEILKSLAELSEQSREFVRIYDPDHTQSLLATLDSLATQVGQIHHYKEEHVLFPALFPSPRLQQGGPRCTHFMDDWIHASSNRASIPDTDLHKSPLGIPLMEHHMLHARLDEIREILCRPHEDPVERRKLHRLTLEYEQLLRRHIEKEDTCLFVLANQILDAETQASLLQIALSDNTHGKMAAEDFEPNQGPK